MNYCWQQLQERNGCATFKRENGRESALTAVVALRHQLQHNSVVYPQLYSWLTVCQCEMQYYPTSTTLCCSVFTQKLKCSSFVLGNKSELQCPPKCERGV